MSNYVQSTNFATKDALSSGDPLKIVKGTEINTEFANIAIAVATKADSSSLPTIASTGEAQAGTENTKFITSLRLREGFNASGTAPVFAVRAWVNFNGSTTPPTIVGSGNITSVTRTATGTYSIALDIAMPSAGYAVSAVSNRITELVSAPTTTTVGIFTKLEDGSLANATSASVAVFG